MDNASSAARDPVNKAFQILARIADGPNTDLGVREIASALDLAPATTHRLLTVLEANGLVRRTPQGKYQLGLEIMRLSWLISTRFSLVEAARPPLEELVRECNETALLGLYDANRGKMMFALAVESDHPLRYVIRLHEWVPIYAAASGLAIFAFLPESERRAVLQSAELKPLTVKTMLDPAQIEEQAAYVRKRGYAISHGQRLDGAVGIAAPVWGHDGRVVGDVVLTLPEQRFLDTSEDALVQGVVAAASKLSAQLTHDLPPGGARIQPGPSQSSQSSSGATNGVDAGSSRVFADSG